MIGQKTVAEFFAGIGLMRMGLEQAGWQTLWANDIDEKKMRMYQGHFGKEYNKVFHLDDIHNISSSDVPTVSLATASFPCNDLSLAGSRRGLAGKQSGAFWGFVKVLENLKNRRPPLVMLENVPGFLTSHGGKDFYNACVALNELGYELDALMVDAVNFVPQSRLRLFIIGKQTYEGNVREEITPFFFETECRPRALAEFILCNPDIAWNLEKLPQLPDRMTTLADIIEELPPDSKHWWSEERASYLLGQMSERHAAIATDMIAGKSTSYGTVFRRVRNGRSMAELRADSIAGCLRTPRGGSGRQILFIAGNGKYSVRLLTPRECARLMGADDFNITVPFNQALFGFGDAVCVPAIRWIAENYLNPTMEKISGKSRFGQKLARAI